MDAAGLIDRAVARPVVVFGSLPPVGRDIDLVAEDEELGRITDALEAAGFKAIGGSLLSFRDCGVEAVELVAVRDWSLPDEARCALFRSALPLVGRTNLCRPSPAHAMLIAARRLARARGAAGTKPQRQFAAALGEEPSALTEARRRSAAWGVEDALRALAGEARFGPGRRAAGIYAERRAHGAGRLAAMAGTLVHQAPRPRRRGALVALSGLDGSGKSTQAAALAETLLKLGLEAEVAWVPMEQGPWLKRFAAALRPAVRPVIALRARRAVARSAGAADATIVAHVESAAGREPWLYKSPRLSSLWATVVALRFAYRTGVVLRSRISRGRIVVCDRYVLDAWTYMRFHFVSAPSLRVQFGLARALSPRPLRAFALIVDPQTATSRKADFDAPQNARRARFYDEGSERLDVIAIDGTLPQEEICSRIAEEVWEALGVR